MNICIRIYIQKDSQVFQILLIYCIIIIFFLTPGDTTVAFTARLSLDTELSATGTVIFDDVLLNSGNAYNERNGHFTAHVAGTYQLAVSLTNFGKEAHFAVQKNGHDVLSRLYIKSGLTYSSSTVVLAQLNVGDVVQVKGQYFPTNLREGLYSVFSGFLIK